MDAEVTSYGVVDLPLAGSKLKAPSRFEKNDRSPDLARNIKSSFDKRCRQGLISEAFKSDDLCPLSPRWAVFAVSDGLLRFLSHQKMIPVADLPLWNKDLERRMWEVLWCGVQDELESDHPKLERTFLWSLMYSLVPNKVRMSNENEPVYRSRFSLEWEDGRTYVSRQMSVESVSLVTQLNLSALKPVYTFGLPQDVEDSIRKLAPSLRSSFADVCLFLRRR